jgi:hypothetical protein
MSQVIASSRGFPHARSVYHDMITDSARTTISSTDSTKIKVAGQLNEESNPILKCDVCNQIFESKNARTVHKRRQHML